MTENEKKLLMIDNKRKIKEMNGLNTDKEELEMIAAALEDVPNRISEQEIEEYNQERTQTISSFTEKYNVILSEVLEFKIYQLWDIYKKELPILNLKKEFYELKCNKDTLHDFQISARKFTYLLDELCYAFGDLAKKKADKENYNDIIPEYNYEGLTFDKLQLKHSYYDCNNYIDYILSTEEAFDLLFFICEYIEDAINDKTKEKCTTASNVFMIVSVEVEGMYACEI